MDLKTNELHIWRYSLDEQDYHNEKTSPLLSKKEQDRCNSFLFEIDKIRYVCNHRFVRQVLSQYLNSLPSQIEFSYSSKGKPFIKNSGLFFNYSYRSDLGLLAVSKNQEVGVDIEKMKALRDPATFASFSFSENEKEIIFKSDEKAFQETLFIFWTFKEAIIKALGVGLNADLTQIDLSEFFKSELNPLPFDNNEIYTIKQIGAKPGFKAAFAMKGEVKSFTEFKYKKN